MKKDAIAQIYLTQGKVTIIDKDDLEKVNKHKWYFNGGYAFSYINGRPLVMHVLIMNTPPNMHTDHINHDTLDNRKVNLRIVTPAENYRNRRSYIGNENPFWGKKHSREICNSISKRCSKRVLQFSKNGLFIAEYKNTLEAEAKTGASNGSISNVCNGRYKTAGGFVWKYASDSEAVNL